MGQVNLGDVIIFNWHKSDFPNHASVTTRISSDGTAATHGFGAWGDTMTFHEVELAAYDGDATKGIIGYGNLSGIIGLDALEAYRKLWEGRPVAADWDGSKGNVCIDGVTAIDGYGGAKLRAAMLADFKTQPGKYVNFGAGKPDASKAIFFRRLAWLVQFFKNTNRYANKRTAR